MFADGVVIPTPATLPVATLSGHAKIAITQTKTAVKNGCHLFSNKKCLIPVCFDFSVGIAIFGFFISLYTMNNTIPTKIAINNPTGIPELSAIEFVGVWTDAKELLRGTKKPVFITALINIYPKSATQLPSSPSPARYHVPVAQPPAKMIPTPKMKEPMITANQEKLPAEKSITPKWIKVKTPTLCTAIAIKSA